MLPLLLSTIVQSISHTYSLFLSLLLMLSLQLFTYLFTFNLLEVKFINLSRTLCTICSDHKIFICKQWGFITPSFDVCLAMILSNEYFSKLHRIEVRIWFQWRHSTSFQPRPKKLTRKSNSQKTKLFLKRRRQSLRIRRLHLKRK